MQRRGLEAATNLVDRLIRSVDGDARSGADEDGDRAGAAGPTEDLVRLWVEVVRMGLDAFGQFLPAAAAGGDNATLDIHDGGSRGIVRVEANAPGQAGDTTDSGLPTELWLHNGSARSYCDVSLLCGDLRAADGATLPAAAVRFEPAVVDLPPRSSRGVVVSIRPDAPPGTYRGVVLVGGVPDSWLPIEVAVNSLPEV